MSLGKICGSPPKVHLLQNVSPRVITLECDLCINSFFLAFWGDSSNTALLNYIKSTVRVLIGSSSFTSDPEELEVEKTGTRIRDDTKPIYLLPSPETSNFLKSSFFINVKFFLQLI